jgi:UDP-glucose 4-epimerase
MIKNILITGGTGYVGSHITVKLLELGYNVTLVDNFSNSKRSIINKIKKITKKNFSFYKLDILDTKNLFKIFKKKKIQLVFHLAAFKSVNESVIFPEKYFKNNIFGITSLISAMEKACVYNLIFSSSAVVYGNSMYLPINENHPTNPLSPYGISKLFGEQYLSYIQSKNKRWKIISLRYFNPVGSHISKEIGDNPINPNNIMPRINKVALNNKSSFKIFGYNYKSKDGTAVRDYIHIMDVVDAHLLSLKKIKKISQHAIFNIGTGKGVSVNELLKVYQKVNKLKLKLKKTARRKGDIAVSYACVKKIKNKIGWKSKYSIKDMCVSSYEFAKSVSKKN